MSGAAKRLAFIVSHPVQYYVPLYRQLAKRDDLSIRVFFTWHAGTAPVHDRGFNVPVAWDIPLTDGYQFELVPNVASHRGTHRFLGLRNPSLVERVVSWKPDAAHITGWAGASHLNALRSLRRHRIPTLFRGDSHLLDSPRRGLRWQLKRAALRRIYMWPTAFLVVGAANRAYYEAFGVGPDRMFDCPHSIDVRRFAEPAQTFDSEALHWKRQLQIPEGARVILYAGKFEAKKRPVELMRAVLGAGASDLVLVMVGGGELQAEVDALANANPSVFRVLPFQNQSRMPIVYRVGDLFVLPSAFDETWGLAVNEALACGRPVLVSDRVGCASDVVDDTCGRVFPWDDSSTMMAAMQEITADPARLRHMGEAARQRAWSFDIERTQAGLVCAVQDVCSQ